ncbi:MAG: universal stress protein [Gemmatimonadota bacterium]
MDGSVKDPVLVATDGGRSAASALEFAASYAAREGVAVEVVSVVEPLSDLPMPLPHREELEHAHARGVAARVRQHVRDSVGAVSWPVHVRLGRPAPAICTTARERKARLVILGMDPKKADGNATAVELLHLAERPVLVAHSGTLPDKAVVGIDFRPSSLRAAEEALRLVRAGGTLHLVHVQPSLDFPAASVWGWGTCYDGAVADAFDALAESLLEKGAGEVCRHCGSGDPAEELMKAAEELEAHLLAIGSDGYICNGRVVVGRVARRILARADVPVLATPVVTSMEGPFAGLDVEGAATARQLVVG